MTESSQKKRSLKGERIKKNLKLTGKVIWMITKITIILIIMAGFLAAGAVTGYVASMVKDMPTPSQQEIREKVNEGWQVGFAYFADGSEIGQLRAEENRRMVSLDEISPHVINAFIATEDRSFYEHPGVDLQAAVRASWQNFQSGTIVSGFSSITQQLARNTFLTHEQSIERKVREVFLALRMERALSKEEILTAYVNKIYFGRDANASNLYGIEAASLGFFGLPSSDLNLAQSAILAGLPQSPHGHNLYNNLDSATSRQHRVLGYMYNNGFITKDELDEARDYDIAASLVVPEPRAYSRYPFLMMDIEDRASEALVNAGLFDNKTDALYAVLSSGIHVHTTVEKDLQDILDSVLQDPENFMENVDYDHPLTGELIEDAMQEAGMTMLDPKTGAIWAMGGGRDFHTSQTNHTRAPRQPGSALKTLAVYGPAMELKQVMPGTVIDDAPYVRPDPSVASGIYFPQNWDNKFHGLMTARTAMQWSYNIPALKVFEQIGPSTGVGFLERMNFQHLTRGDFHHLSVAIGGLEQGVTVEEMIAGHATFANKGIFNPAYMISKITDRNGDILFEHELEPTPIYTEQTTFMMNDLLRTVARSGTGGRVGGAFPGRDIIGKTGTTNNSRDLWFLGYTPDVALGVFTGFDIPYPMPRSESPRAVLLFNAAMKQVFEKYPERFPADNKFVEPSGISRVLISTKSGKLASELAIEAGWTTTELFLKGTEPTEECDVVVRADYVEVDGVKYLPSIYTPPESIRSGIFIKRTEPYELPEDNEKHKPIDAIYELPTEIDPLNTHDSSAPIAPRDVLITENTTDSITLRWAINPDPDLAGYVVERSLYSSGGFEQVLDLFAGDYLTENRYQDNNVDSETIYYYRVVAIDDQGRRSPPSRVIKVRPGLNSPSAPENAKISINEEGIVMTWAANNVAEELNLYRVMRSVSPDGPYNGIAVTLDTHYIDRSADENSFYWYRIIAENDSGVSSHTTTLTMVDMTMYEQAQAAEESADENAAGE